MRKLNNFILEKLKINSKSKVNNTLLDRIISLLGIPSEIQEDVIDNINDWINGKLSHNKKIIEGVIPIAYPSIIDKMEKKGIKKEITDEYKRNNSIENCKTCEDEYVYTYHLCSNDRYELRYNESILVFIDNTIPNYILYLYNEKRFY